MTTIIEKLARALCIENGTDPDYRYDPAEYCSHGVKEDVRWKLKVSEVRAVLQTLHDNITPEMVRAGVEEYAVQTYATESTEEEAVSAIIQRVIATALKGERA